MKTPYEIWNGSGASPVVIVCEHARHFIPAKYANLGLDDAAAVSHAAWDPGALAVTQRMADNMDAVAVTGTISRLVYDLNRPPSSPEAFRDKSERIDVPGNAGLSPDECAKRAAQIYEPFSQAVSEQLAKNTHPILITVHSFTPVFHGQPRDVEIGILHDSDTRLADVMIKLAAKYTRLKVACNAPYGPEDGVTHTLSKHAIPAGYPNVMLEIRNDLIEETAQQIDIADMLTVWVTDAIEKTRVASGGPDETTAQ